ncbi:GD24303 [Drosophila simulans]|uniref:GD24303 n=1 Tax=Drosophila simulans TaxID=7240 RepID=B4Q3Z1_DROSI|nr:GD24303 [Drosophila simulans]
MERTKAICEASSHLWITCFCTGSDKLDKPRKGKFQAKGREYVFVGYSPETKAYRLYDPEKRSAMVRPDVKFLEGFFVKHYSSRATCRNLTAGASKSNQDTKHSDLDEEGEEFVSANDEEEPLEQVEISARHGPGRPRTVLIGERGSPRKQYN